MNSIDSGNVKISNYLLLLLISYYGRVIRYTILIAVVKNLSYPQLSIKKKTPGSYNLSLEQ